MQNTRPMSGKSGIYPCTACNANIPQEDKHTLCVWCLGVQHAILALERDVACNICEAFQPRVKEARLERAKRASSTSSMAGPSAALGAPEPLLHDLSQDPLLGILDAQAACSRSPSLRARRVKRSKQARDIMDLKAQMAQGVQGGWEEASLPAQEDMLSIAASGEEASFSSEMQVGKTPAEEEPGFKVASEASAPPLSSSVSAADVTDGTRCSFLAGPLDASGGTTPVRIPDAGDGSSPSEIPGLPRLHGGGTLLLGSSGLGPERAKTCSTACLLRRRR
ncbi:UNVERIFIED_CONTAM: hypothetical protein FKN15_063033 [Acipenser sinensis]